MKKTRLFKSAAMCAFALLCCVFANAQTKAPGELLDKADFEMEIDGKPVSLYTITNGRITAQVTNFAGYIVGIYTPDKDGNYTNVVGHNDNIQQYQTFSRNPVGAALGRYANRIGNATFTLDGVKYEVTKNNGQHTLHGGSKGFDHTVWDVEKVTGSSVVMSCVLQDGLDGFPGTLKTTLTFSITDDDGVAVNYEATTDKPTVCNLSHHVYFNLNGFPAENALDHVVCINADAITETDNTLIPTGKLLPVEGTPYDFRKPVKLGDRQVAAPAGRGAFGGPAVQLPARVLRTGSETATAVSNVKDFYIMSYPNLIVGYSNSITSFSPSKSKIISVLLFHLLVISFLAPIIHYFQAPGKFPHTKPFQCK